MPKILIIGYRIGWNPNKKQGAVEIKLQNGQASKVPVGTAEEFCAISMVLNESPIFLDTDSGYIATIDWEPVGGA